jgi:energy-coupling factor transporter ATP-binding protein EcfA2
MIHVAASAITSAIDEFRKLPKESKAAILASLAVPARILGRAGQRTNRWRWDRRIVKQRRDEQQSKREALAMRRVAEKNNALLTSTVEPQHAPADLEGEDFFAVRALAENLSKSFASTTTMSPESEVWSLLGPWGSGKSTIVEYISNLLEDKHKHDLRVVRFEPWLLQDTHDLYSEFLSLLASARNDRRATKIIRRLKRSTDKTPDMPGIGTALKVLVSFRTISNEEAYRRLRSIFKSNSSLGPFRIRLPQQMHALKRHRILVVIDDIDRLGKDEILTVMKLVKVVGNLHGVDYLLCYDEEIVHRVLAQTHLETEDRAKQYMKKIVQHEVFVPETKNSKDGFHNYLHSNKNFRLLGLRGDEIVEKYAEKLLVTPRDLSRYASGFDEAVHALGEEPKSKVNLHELAMIELIRVVDRDLYRYILNHRMGLASWDVCVQKDERTDLIQQIPTNPSPELKTRCKALGGLLRHLYPEPGTVPRTRSILRPDYVNRYFGLASWDDEFDLGKPDAVYHDQSPTDRKKSRKIPDPVSKLVKANISQAVTQLDVMTAAVSGTTGTETKIDKHPAGETGPHVVAVSEEEPNPPGWTESDRITYFRLWSDTYFAASRQENAPMVTIARRATLHAFFKPSDTRWEAVLGEAPHRWQFLLELAAAHIDDNYGHTYGRVDPTTAGSPQKTKSLEIGGQTPIAKIADNLIQLAIRAAIDCIRRIHRPNSKCPRSHLPMPTPNERDGNVFADGLWLLTPLSMVAPDRALYMLGELNDHKHPPLYDPNADIDKQPPRPYDKWNKEFKQQINAANLRVDTYLEYLPSIHLHTDSVFRGPFRTSGTYVDFQTFDTDAKARKWIADLMGQTPDDVKKYIAPYSIWVGIHDESIKEGTFYASEKDTTEDFPPFVTINIDGEKLKVWDPRFPPIEDFENIIGTEAAINELRRGDSVRKLVLEECAKELERKLNKPIDITTPADNQTLVNSATSRS